MKTGNGDPEVFFRIIHFYSHHSHTVFAFFALYFKNMEEKFIKIDEVIERAKFLGVNFGKGNPRNRLRYYAKLGLLPPAQRKVFEGTLPTGAYPEWVINVLVNIDRELKKGKTIHNIVEQQKKKQNVFDSPKEQEMPQKSEAVKTTETISPFGQTTSPLQPPRLKKFCFPSLASMAMLLLIAAGGILLFLGLARGDAFFAALVREIGRVAQVTELAEPEEDISLLPQDFILTMPEPYLTIDVETDIYAPLNLKSRGDEAARLSFFQDDLQGTFSLGSITDDRTYTLPDDTGTVCLSTGNCVGLFGEIFSPGGSTNRLAKFTAPQRIGDASIIDEYDDVALYITSTGDIGIGTPTPETELEVAGDITAANLFATNAVSSDFIFAQSNIGIGTESPDYALDVQGRIQATGDICTDLAGGKCLSELTEAAPMFFGRTAAADGVEGSGTAGYISKWTSGDTLGNSVLFESDSNIGINVGDPNEKLTVSGAISLAHIDEPSETEGYGKIYVKEDGKLYYQDEEGTVYDLLAEITGIAGIGSPGQIAFFSATSTIEGDSDFFWDIENQRLGIGTTSPLYALDVSGTAQMAGFKMPFGASSGYVLTADASGAGTWQEPPGGISGIGGSGTTNYIPRFSGTTTLADSIIYQDSGMIGIGTTTPDSALSIAGNMSLNGQFSLTLATTSIPQFVLKYDDDNQFNVSISSATTTLTSSNNLVIDSLTGEITFSTNKLDASLASVHGSTFISTDSTVRKEGERVFRGAVPVFKFSVPVQTATTSYTGVSKHFKTELNAFPELLEGEGSERKYAFIINFADDIDTESDSEWRIYGPNANEVHDTFTLSGQDLAFLDRGFPQIADDVALPENDWQLEVRVPAGKKIRIFNIMLLAYDEVN